MRSRAATIALIGASLVLAGCDPLGGPRTGPQREGAEGEVEQAVIDYALLRDRAACEAATPNALAQLYGVPPSAARDICERLTGSRPGDADEGGIDASSVEIDGDEARVAATVESPNTFSGELELLVLRTGGRWRVERITVIDVDYDRTIISVAAGATAGAGTEDLTGCTVELAREEAPKPELEAAIIRGAAFRGLAYVAAVCAARSDEATAAAGSAGVPPEVLECATLRILATIPVRDLIIAGTTGGAAQITADAPRAAQACQQGAPTPDIAIATVPGVALPPIGDAGTGAASSGGTKGGSGEEGGAPDGRGSGGGRQAEAPARKPAPEPRPPSRSRYLDCIAAHPDEIKRCAKRFL